MSHDPMVNPDVHSIYEVGFVGHMIESAASFGRRFAGTTPLYRDRLIICPGARK